MRQLVRGEEWGNHIITSNKRRTIVDLMPTVYAVYKHIIALARRNVLFLLSFKSAGVVSGIFQ